MRGSVGIESGIVGRVRKGPSTCPDLQQCHSTPPPPLERYHMWCSPDQSPLPPQLPAGRRPMLVYPYVLSPCPACCHSHRTASLRREAGGECQPGCPEDGAQVPSSMPQDNRSQPTIHDRRRSAEAGAASQTRRGQSPRRAGEANLHADRGPRITRGAMQCRSPLLPCRDGVPRPARITPMGGRCHPAR